MLHVFQFGARRMGWMVVRVEDLLEEARREGDEAVDEAEVWRQLQVAEGRRWCTTVSTLVLPHRSLSFSTSMHEQLLPTACLVPVYRCTCFQPVGGFAWLSFPIPGS